MISLYRKLLILQFNSAGIKALLVSYGNSIKFLSQLANDSDKKAEIALQETISSMTDDISKTIMELFSKHLC